MSNITKMASVKKKVKPTAEEVIKYAMPIIKQYISKYATNVPFEQKEEILQTAYVRVLEAFKRIKVGKGWKSFVYNHSRGAVLDYLKFGKGFQEDKWSIKKTEEHGSQNVNKIRSRLYNSSSGSQGGEYGADHDNLEFILADNNVFSKDDFTDKIKINWELLSRMAAHDKPLHAFAKWIRGYSIEEIAPVFGVSRARIGQYINSFIKRFHDPKVVDNGWNSQIIYALGICAKFDLNDENQKVYFGAQLTTTSKPVDFDCMEPFDESQYIQLSLFA